MERILNYREYVGTVFQLMEEVPHLVRPFLKERKTVSVRQAAASLGIIK